MRQIRAYERGDTIVEMVLAFAIFSLVAVGTMNILNTGVAIAQQNLESSLVQQQIDSQAEMIRYIRNNDQTTWQNLITTGNLADNPASIDLAGACPTNVAADAKFAKGFFVKYQRSGTHTTYSRVSLSGTSYGAPSTYARVDYTAGKSLGIWVQAARAEGPTRESTIQAYDFYIHACWSATRGATSTTRGTIVRLYDGMQ